MGPVERRQPASMIAMMHVCRRIKCWCLHITKQASFRSQVQTPTGSYSVRVNGARIGLARCHYVLTYGLRVSASSALYITLRTYLWAAGLRVFGSVHDSTFTAAPYIGSTHARASFCMLHVEESRPSHLKMIKRHWASTLYDPSLIITTKTLDHMVLSVSDMPKPVTTPQAQKVPKEIKMRTTPREIGQEEYSVPSFSPLTISPGIDLKPCQDALEFRSRWATTLIKHRTCEPLNVSSGLSS